MDAKKSHVTIATVFNNFISVHTNKEKVIKFKEVESGVYSMRKNN